jgi:hypothetical protein
MRELADARRIQKLMQGLSDVADREATVYFTGGASAVLFGWRATTIDVDLRFVPDSDRLLRAIPNLKEELQINVELASPSDFIPELPGWQERSRFIEKKGRLSFFHYDFYSQALAKIERGHEQDVRDVKEMLERGLVEPIRALGYFDQIESRLYLYPAIDPTTFRKAAERILRPGG